MILNKSLLLFAVISAIIFGGCSRNQSNKTATPALRLDQYGGLIDITGNNTSGFFRTELINNRWLFVDPDNHAFFSLGSDVVNFSPEYCPFCGFSEYNHAVLSIFPSMNAKLLWVNEVRSRYKILHFNSLGNWSENGLTVFQDTIPYTVPMNFLEAVSNNFGTNNCPVINKGFWTDFPDVYDQRFSQNAYAYAKQVITPGFVNDPWLIGYFPDNEISWFGGGQLFYNSGHTLADDYIALPASYAGKQYWVNIFLQKKLGYTLTKLNDLYGTDFNTWSDVLNITALPNNTSYPQIYKDKQKFIFDIASTYFSVTNDAIKSVDPNHLNLCSRFASYVPDQVVEAAAEYCDVISVNDYYALDNPLSNAAIGNPVKRWTHMFELAEANHPYGRPFIQSEFGMRGRDSGLPNKKGAGWVVDTQNERGQFYRDDLSRLLSIKVNGIVFLAGFHWFQWSDEPATGRFDGENSNYGLVNIKDEPYTTVFNSISNTTKTFLYSLLHIKLPVLEPPDFITETTAANGGINISWAPVTKAVAYTVIISPYRTMPERFTISIDNIPGTTYKLPYNLPQGIWWFGVKAEDNDNIQSDFSTLSDFTVSTSTKSTELCMDMEDSGCFTNNITDTFPKPDNAVGDGVIMPSRKVKDEGTQAGRISFTINSLAVQAGLPVSAIVTIGMNQSIPVNGASALSFDVYPKVVYTPSGAYRSATDFVHFRLMDGSTILYDSPLPSSLPPYAWSTVTISLSGITAANITPVFYVNAHANDIPYDQRITFYLDNMHF